MAYVLPGELFVQAAPTNLLTVLGSCVSVCLWSEEAQLGGLNHFLLPVAKDQDGEYLGGDIATPALIELIGKRGCHPRRLVAKVFGGAYSGRHAWNVGAENILMAWRELRKAGIPIINADVGGNFGRQIRFDTATGAVQVRRLRWLSAEGRER